MTPSGLVGNIHHDGFEQARPGAVLRFARWEGTFLGVVTKRMPGYMGRGNVDIEMLLVDGRYVCFHLSRSDGSLANVWLITTPPCRHVEAQ